MAWLRHGLVWCPGVPCGDRDKIKEKHLSLSSTEESIALTPEIDCDQMAMGLPPLTSAVLLIAK
jgi:hypothetical protein